MLKLRLTRTGKRNDPRFRIVVAEHTKPVKGKFIAIVGHYDPIHKDIVIKKEEIKKWLDNGAKPSNRVAILLKKEGIKHPSIVIQKFNKKPKGKKKDSEESKESVNKNDSKESKDSDDSTKAENTDNKEEKKEDAKTDSEKTRESEKSDDKKPEEKKEEEKK